MKKKTIKREPRSLILYEEMQLPDDKEQAKKIFCIGRNENFTKKEMKILQCIQNEKN